MGGYLISEGVSTTENWDEAGETSYILQWWRRAKEEAWIFVSGYIENGGRADTSTTNDDR